MVTTASSAAATCRTPIAGSGRRLWSGPTCGLGCIIRIEWSTRAFFPRCEAHRARPASCPIGKEAAWKPAACPGSRCRRARNLSLDPGGSDDFPCCARSPVPVRHQLGRFFQFALPDGWRVQEDGQFAVVLVAPDSCALTVMTGNAGLPVSMQPGQFVWERLSQL